MKLTKLNALVKKLSVAGISMASTVFGVAGGGCDGGTAEMVSNGNNLSAIDLPGFGSTDQGSSSGIPVQR